MTFISVEIHILEIELLVGEKAAKWIVWSQHWQAEEQGAPYQEACQSIATALGGGERDHFVFAIPKLFLNPDICQLHSFEFKVLRN